MDISILENTSDVISRQAALEAFNVDMSGISVTISGRGAGKVYGYVKTVTDRIKALPTVQPKRGKWIDKSGGIEGAWNYCSVCGEQAIDLYDFCPNCGADMRGEANGGSN